MVYSQNGILISSEKNELLVNTNMDESQEYYIEQKKPK